MGVEDLGHDSRVVEKIGGKEEPATRFQKAQNQINRLGIEEAPTLVSRLGPRIRKVDMHGRSKPCRQHSRQEIERLAPNKQEIIEISLDRPLANQAEVLSSHLDAYETLPRALGRTTQ
jgi:hypothetical protein